MKRGRIRGAFVRMCAGCGTRRKQDEMIRLVRDKDGTVHVAPTDGTEGRSAYVCRDKKCFEKLKKSKRLSTLLRTSDVTEAVYKRLEEIIDG